MTIRLDDHVKSEDGEICLWDHEDWPCHTVQVADLVRVTVADEILTAVEQDTAYRPKWVGGMKEAARVALKGKKS